MPDYGWTGLYGNPSYAPQMSKEEELDLLKVEATALKAQLDDIEARIKSLEGE